MPKLNVMNPLNPTGVSGYITEADKIAYSTTTTTDGDGTEVSVLEKSVKTKIDEINVDIQSKVQQAQTYANNAQTAYNNTRTISQSVSESVDQINQIKNNIDSTAAELSGLKEDVSDLKVSFDPNAQIEIMSEETYANLDPNLINSNIIYLLYEN